MVLMRTSTSRRWGRGEVEVKMYELKQTMEEIIDG